MDAGFTYNEPTVQTVDDIEEFLDLTIGMPRLVFGSPAYTGNDGELVGELSEQWFQFDRPDENITVLTELTKTEKNQQEQEEEKLPEKLPGKG